MEVWDSNGMLQVVPPADNSLSYGVIRGDVPIAGKFNDGDSSREVDGSMYWNTKVPELADDGKLEVIVFLHARDREIQTAIGEMRIGCETVRLLFGRDPDAEAELLSNAVEMALEKGYGEYAVRCAR